MATLRKSLMINFAQNYGVIALQFVASIILARLLSPSEIGIYAVASTLIGLAQVVRDFGVGQYIIQEKELTQDRIKSAFGLSIITSVFLATIVASLCNVAADFYREPGVRNVMLVLAVNFLLIPFGQITLAYLRREMRFGAIAIVTIGSTVAHVATSIILAYLDFSYMSLAYAALAGVVVSAVIATFYRPNDMPWAPGFKQLRSVVEFGSFSVLANIANALAKGVGDLVLGRMMNMSAVGLFSRASGLIQIFNQGVMNALWAVALPHFSKSVRENRNIQDDYLRSTCLITGLAWPFFGVLSLLAEPMVMLLYGAQWVDCVPLVKWICLAFLIIAPFFLFSSVLVAIGQVKKVMWIEVGTIPIQFVVFIFGASTGDLEIVAIASVAYATLKAAAIYFVLRLHLKFSHFQFISSLWRSLTAMVICMAILKLSLETIPTTTGAYWQSIAIGSLGATIGWLAGIYATNHPLGIELKSAVGRLIAKRLYK